MRDEDTDMKKKDCIAALESAGASAVDARDIVEAMLRRKKELAAGGTLDRAGAELAASVMRDFDAAAMDAAHRHRQAALTILRRSELDAFVSGAKADGFSFLDALEARMVGSAKRMFGARQSADARRSAIFKTFTNRFERAVAEIAAKHDTDAKVLFDRMAKDRGFLKDFANERLNPGSVKDAVVRELVGAYEALSEEMRLRLNAAGANIAKLEGRLPQSHDQLKLLDARLGGREGWIDFTAGLIDAGRSLPGKSVEEVRGILGNIYNNIATGRNRLGFEAGGKPVSMGNIAAGLGRHRVLHFKDADSWIAYIDRYGRRGLWEAVYGEMDTASRKLALMETFGPNPESMIRSLLEEEKNAVRRALDAGEIDASTAREREDALERSFTRRISPTGSMAHYLAVLTGETQSPVSVGAAKAFGLARSVQSMAKLGGAVLSATADLFTKAASMRVNGAGFFERHTRPFLDILKRYDAREREIAGDLGFLLEAENASLIHRFDQADTMPGRVSSLMNTFFKYSGLTIWTERNKAGTAMWLSHTLGRSGEFSFDALHPDIRAMLEYHGFGPEKWDVFRAHMIEEYDGKKYLNPSLARNLADESIAHLLPERLQGTARKGYTPEQWKSARQRELARIRVNLETEARAFFADETKFAIIEPDAKTTAVMTQGTAPGTPVGEGLRAIMQFKSFPIAYWQRMIAGRRWRRGSRSADVPGFIEYALSAAAYGYVAMTLKDIAKNRTPRKVWDDIRKRCSPPSCRAEGRGFSGISFSGRRAVSGTACWKRWPVPLREPSGISRRPPA
jgi:hypothetical protein